MREGSFHRPVPCMLSCKVCLLSVQYVEAFNLLNAMSATASVSGQARCGVTSPMSMLDMDQGLNECRG